MNEEKYYTDFCTGCGLCKTAVGVEYITKDGFEYPKSLNAEQIEFCEKICPVNAINFNNRTDDELWGPNVGCYSGWSTNTKIRHKSAKGGIITSLCCYLIESKKCDAIIQVSSLRDNPFSLTLKINKTVDDIIECSSSKYITYMTYADLESKIYYNQKYAIIGKPCDIEAITNYMRINKDLNSCIKYRLTFFCAGAPSVNSNKNLATTISGVSLNNIKSIRYRGNGWPGKAEITLNDNSKKTMEYIDSWNYYLGRDIRKMCKFCTNGIGIYADISCGDLWKLKDNKPTFDDAPGVNIVFARSEIGNALLQEAKSSGYIVLENYNNAEKLEHIQPNHYNMQTRTFAKILGLALTSFGSRQVPKYNLKQLHKHSKGVPALVQIKTILGTIKRKITNQL